MKVSAMSSTLDEQVRTLCQGARRAARTLAPRSRADTDRALEAIAKALEENADEILSANAHDLDAARERGTKGALLDRLMLDPKRLQGIVKSVREIIDLDDPVGEVISKITRPNGLIVSRTRVPLGVI